MSICVDVNVDGGETTFLFFQAEDGIRDLVRSRGLGDVYKRQGQVGVSRAHFLEHQRGLHGFRGDEGGSEQIFQDDQLTLPGERQQILVQDVADDSVEVAFVDRKSGVLVLQDLSLIHISEPTRPY